MPGLHPAAPWGFVVVAEALLLGKFVFVWVLPLPIPLTIVGLDVGSDDAKLGVGVGLLPATPPPVLPPTLLPFPVLPLPVLPVFPVLTVLPVLPAVELALPLPPFCSVMPGIVFCCSGVNWQNQGMSMGWPLINAGQLPSRDLRTAAEVKREEKARRRVSKAVGRDMLMLSNKVSQVSATRSTKRAEIGVLTMNEI